MCLQKKLPECSRPVANHQVTAERGQNIIAEPLLVVPETSNIAVIQSGDEELHQTGKEWCHRFHGGLHECRYFAGGIAAVNHCTGKHHTLNMLRIAERSQQRQGAAC